MKRIFWVVIIVAFLFNSIVASACETNTDETYTYGDYSYSLNDENGVTIVSYNGEEREVVIPSEICGKTVTCIWSDSFCYNYNIEKVKIPNGVTRIENFAFYDCINLKEVIFPNSLIYIGAEAFAYCAIEEIVFPESLEYIDGEAFACCESLKKRRFESSETIYFFTAFDNTPFEESYRNDKWERKADNLPLFIKKVVVFFQGIDLSARHNGNIQHMSEEQISVYILMKAILLVFALVLIVYLIALFFWLISKGVEAMSGEANKHGYSKFNTAFIKEFGSLSYGFEKYKKHTTFGERFFKKIKLIFGLSFWLFMILASLGIGTYIRIANSTNSYIMTFFILVLSVVIIPLATKFLFDIIYIIFSKIKHGIKKNLNSDKNVMRIVDVKKGGVKYE